MNRVITLPPWLIENAFEKEKADAAWLSAHRNQHWNAFIQKGIPDRSNERYKYTDLSLLSKKHFSQARRMQEDELSDVIHQHRLQRGESILLTIVNGYFMPSLSDIAKLPQGVMACHLSDAQTQHADCIQTGLIPIDANQYPLASLNAAISTEGLFFFLPDQCEVELPIHLLSLTVDENEFIAHPQHIFLLGKNSKLTLLEEHFSLRDQTYAMNTVTLITAGHRANLDYYKIQREGKQAIHLAHTFIRQLQDSHITYTHFSSGSQFSREDVVVMLQESGANCSTAGFYSLHQDHQYMDHHIDINHCAPHSHSEMLYKGIIDNKAKAVFNGRLHVEAGAQKITAYQANHHLLLSDDAEAYSKPELEIYADDVKCKHGATTGQLDQDALFYMRARGIEKNEAAQILLQGFAEEILERVKDAGIKMRVQEWM